MITLERPAPEEVFTYFQTYISKAPGDDLFTALRVSADRATSMIAALSEERAEHRYAPGKWSIKEVFQHVIDTERIFCYRALTFARQDTVELPGFEENDYADHADVGRRTMVEIGEELKAVRAGTIALFQSFSSPMLLSKGTANGKRMSVRALGWTLAGHAMHHMDVIDQRYL